MTDGTHVSIPLLMGFTSSGFDGLNRIRPSRRTCEFSVKPYLSGKSELKIMYQSLYTVVLASTIIRPVKPTPHSLSMENVTGVHPDGT